MHTKGRLAPTRTWITVLFLLFALVFSLLPSVHLPAVQAQDEASPYIWAVYDEPRNSSAPYEEVGDLARAPALSAPGAPFVPAAGMTAYTELDTLFVIYTNTAAGSLNTTDVARLKDHANETARFIWKQSHFKFLVRLTFMVINTHKDMTEFTEVFPGAYWLNPTDDDGDGKSVEADLLARGVTANQYDSIDYLWAHNNDTVPIAFGGLSGLIDWRLGFTGNTANPVFQLSGSEKFSTAFPHEVQHTIDFMMDLSGYPQYFNADRPWDYSGAFGEDWSFWEYQMRFWPVDKWLVLSPPWGDILQIADADGDGVPDSGTGLPITEATLGGSASMADSDSDGVADIHEANAGMFRNWNLTQPDTDRDLATDDRDPEPLYAMNTKILKKNLAMNGNPSGWDVLTRQLEQTNTPFAPVVYANWNSNYLFLMVRVDNYAGIHLMIDANADGWFSGKDNYFFAIDPSYSNPTDGLNEAHIWDSSDSTIAITQFPMWDSYPDYPFPRLINPESIGRYSRGYGPGFLTQIAIPANAQTGLVPRHGKRIGLNITYRDIVRDGSREADTFEKNDFAYVTLWDAYANISGSAGIAGVTLTSFGDGATSSVTSNQNGSYSLTVAQGWFGMVTPSHPCFNFSPASRSYLNAFGNQTAQNFTPVFNTSSGCANVHVSVGGVNRGNFGVLPQTSLRTSFSNVNGGLVKIASANGLPIVGAERVIYKAAGGVNTSYSELMGLPDSQLDTTYWLPWYNNRDLDTQLRIGNVSNSTATVRVYIAGAEMPGSPFTISPGASTRASFANVNNGPVKIVSNVNIVASERVIYKAAGGVNASYSELMAFPNRQLDTTYWLPWYENVHMDSQLRLANVSESTATVRVYVRGVEIPSGPITLAPGTSNRLSLPGIDSGPVKIVSNVNILAAKRVIYKDNGNPTSYTEVMAFPNRQLDTTYLLPWFNRINLGTAIRFANISSQTATVRVYLGGEESFVSPLTIPAGAVYYTGFDANSGPLKVTSNVKILVDTPILYSVGSSLTSYVEVMALPNSQLDTIYWLPWYNNKDLDTQLRFGVP